MEPARPLAVPVKCLAMIQRDVLGGFLFSIFLKEMVTCAKGNSFGRSDGEHSKLEYPIDFDFGPPSLLAILTSDFILGTGMNCAQTLHRYLNS